MEGLSADQSVTWMDLNELRKKRDELGRIDPWWVIPTSTDRKDGKWDPEGFVASGRHQIAHTMAQEAVGWCKN